MVIMSNEIAGKLESILAGKFEVSINSKVVDFHNKLRKNEEYRIYHNGITENELFETAKLLSDAYSKFEERDHYVTSRERSVIKCDLNGQTEDSLKVFRKILDVEGSPLHKLVLLTSSASIQFSVDVDRVIDLVAAKVERDTLEIALCRSIKIFNSLKKFYVLPGVTQLTIDYFGTDHIIRERIASAPESSIKLLAFLTANSETMKFKDFLKLDFAESIQVTNSLKNFTIFNSVQSLVHSDFYSTHLQTFTASEMQALDFMLPTNRTLPKSVNEVLVNRSKAIAGNEELSMGVENASISSFMSANELSSCCSVLIKKIDVVLNLMISRIVTPAIFFASIAEIALQFGEKRALDVAITLQLIPKSKSTEPDYVSSVVSLIMEAFDPVNEGIPFGWAAQMSDHSWVLQSTSPSRKLQPAVV